MVTCPTITVDANRIEPATRTCPSLSSRDQGLRRFQEGGLGGRPRPGARGLRGVLEPVCPRSSHVPVTSEAESRVPSLSWCLGRAVCGTAGLNPAADSVTCSVPSAFVSFPPWALMSWPSLRAPGQLRAARTPVGPLVGVAGLRLDLGAACARGACVGAPRATGPRVARASSSPPTRPPLLTRVAQFSSCRRSVWGGGSSEVTGAVGR